MYKERLGMYKNKFRKSIMEIFTYFSRRIPRQTYTKGNYKYEKIFKIFFKSIHMPGM